MNTQQLEACAKFLGAKKLVPAESVITQPDKYKYYAEFPDTNFYPCWTDAELFYALLGKASDLDLNPEVECYGKAWTSRLYPPIPKTHGDSHFSPTPLEALAEAIRRMQE